MANIAFDYDSTITLDPVGFTKVMGLMRDRGHRIYIVTMRYPSEFVKERVYFQDKVDGIICTCRKAKKPATEELGIIIDIWMDDEPKAIHMDAGQIWPTVSPEGTIVSVDHQTGQITTEQIELN